MKYIICLVTCLLVGCGAFVDESEPIRTLESAGYTEVYCSDSNYLTPSWSGCSEEDDVAFSCMAKNPAGKRVSVTVCSNFMFKGSTIRHN